MAEIDPNGARVAATASPDHSDHPRPEPLSTLNASMAEIGSKLDRIEDALHDIAQVLARAVGPPWDETEG